MSGDTDIPDGETGKVVVPDLPLTKLAFRVWRRDKETLLSLNAPAKGRGSWMARQLADPAGGWPQDSSLVARCTRQPHDDPVPSKDCTCGIYATTDLDTISSYLSTDAPVLGIVELGGKVIPGTQGYKAAQVRVAAILLVDEALTEPHAVLRKVAAAYRVPALVPHSTDPEHYRDLIGAAPLFFTDKAIEDFLKGEEDGS